MKRLFGTDGIRGLANQDPITPEMGLKLGRAVVQFCKKRKLPTDILIGRDTRITGEMLEFALVSGVLSAGGIASTVGKLPTPAVAYLTREFTCGAGIVISASHNSYEYNGFKLFSHEGFKLSEEEESEIEKLIHSEPGDLIGANPGQSRLLTDAEERYIAFLMNTASQIGPFQDFKIVLDCANGATSRIAPALFKKLGAETLALFVDPDGKNINLNCGSQNTDTLQTKVLEMGADVGLAFDGDGDRLVAVDEKGKPLSGDHIVSICARRLQQTGELKNNLVVSTVMSNMGLHFALKKLGLKQVFTPVGDRHVVQEMRARDAVLGGEDSGHILFLRHHTTGDGLLSALQLLSAMKELFQPLSELASVMTRFPQVLLNVPVKSKPEVHTVSDVARAIEAAEKKLGQKGKVLVRYSGTEPVCRVMVEGEKREEVKGLARRIAEAVERNMGRS